MMTFNFNFLYALPDPPHLSFQILHPVVTLDALIFYAFSRTTSFASRNY